MSSAANPHTNCPFWRPSNETHCEDPVYCVSKAFEIGAMPSQNPEVNSAEPEHINCNVMNKKAVLYFNNASSLQKM